MAERQSLLIIEDTQDLLDLLVRRFENNYRVYTASDGRSGLEKARERIPDLILLDVNLPDITGFEVLDELKSSETTDDIPVLMMTAVADTESVVTGFRKGAEDYLVKPFNFAELSARINAHLTIRRLQKKLLEMERLNTLHEVTVSFNHEINNPLMSITAFAHFLKTRALDGCPECRESVEGILVEVSRISEKVKQLSEATSAATVEYQPGVRMIDMERLGE